MGEYLVIFAELRDAAVMLKMLGDPDILKWEESPSHLDFLTKWLHKKGFKILPKFFDDNYKPGTVGDEADKLITSVKGCYLGTPGGREDPKPVWDSVILEKPEMREELKRILDENVLDINFKKEVAKELKDIFGETQYKTNDETLKADNENLKRLARILMKLVECIDKAKEARGYPIFFEFYIPRY